MIHSLPALQENSMKSLIVLVLLIITLAGCSNGSLYYPNGLLINPPAKFVVGQHVWDSRNHVHAIVLSVVRFSDGNYGYYLDEDKYTHLEENLVAE
jgi:predicted small lipoprotein YifL